MDLIYAVIPERVLALADAAGGQLAALARNYRAARGEAHRQKVGETLMAAATGPMWLAYYASINGRKGGAATGPQKANGGSFAPKLSAERIEVARRMRADGCTWQDIALHFGARGLSVHPRTIARAVKSAAIQAAAAREV